LARCRGSSPGSWTSSASWAARSRTAAGTSTSPAGAIAGDARITIVVAYAKSGECTMELTPADKNKFDVPALLTVDCASLTDEQLAQSVLLEFDPVTRRWFEVPGSSVDVTHRTVSARVDHVARYTVGPAGGKAGW
jgi:hypothetical protein